MLSLIVAKPPFWQFNPCVVSYFWPQGHVAGKFFNSFPYLNSIASLNSAVFKAKPYCSSGMTLSQDDVPGWLASSIAFFVWTSSFWLMVSIFSFSKTSLSFYLFIFFFDYLVSFIILLSGIWHLCMIITEARGADIDFECL